MNMVRLPQNPITVFATEVAASNAARTLQANDDDWTYTVIKTQKGWVVEIRDEDNLFLACH